MFTLKSFIKSIQDAILNANDALMEKNLDILNKYFEGEGDIDELVEKINVAKKAAKEVLDRTTKVTRRSLKNAMDSLEEVNKAFEDEDTIEEILVSGNLHPKTVVLNYPVKTPKGLIESKEVHVPLITLVPIAFSQIEQLKLIADLELHLVNDEVQVSLGKFSGKKSGFFGMRSKDVPKSSIGSIEIIIKPQESSDGMKQIIDAYERVLKSQLPN